MPAAEAGSISSIEAAKLFAPFEGHARLALAVSGGADSTALLFLIERWRRTLRRGPELFVLTVDHGLRQGSRAEAEAVVRMAHGFGLQARLLEWRGDKPQTGLQAAAREARYALLSEAAWALSAEAIVTAHTADDQAETVLMRLARGSGLDGLAGMAPASCRDGMRLLRPLLSVSHARLVATLEAEGLSWFEDPSNENIDFERIRMRRLLAELAGAGIGGAALARSAMRLGRARAAIDVITAEAFRRLVTVHPQGFLEMQREGFAAQPQEIRVRLLGRAVALAGGSDAASPLSGLEDLAAWLGEGKGRARTLAGARIVRRQSVLLFGREPGRLALCPVPLGGGDTLWDGRFLIRRLKGNGARASGIAILPGRALGDEVLRLAGETPDLPRFVTDSRPVAVADGVALGFAGAVGHGIEATFVALREEGGQPVFLTRAWP